jgi:hypothetical protein
MQQSFAHLFATLVITAVMSAASQAAPAGDAAQNDPQAVSELTAARGKFAALRTYRTRMSMGGQEVMVIETVRPDRTRIRIPAPPPAPATEITMIGNDQWQRSGTACRRASGSPIPVGRDDSDPTRVQGTATVQRGAPENIEGAPMQVYLVTSEFQGQQGRQKFYVLPTTGMIRRMETSSAQGTLTFDYFDYDAAITITAPC